MKYNRKKKSALVVYLPLLMSASTLLGFLYFLYHDGYFAFPVQSISISLPPSKPEVHHQQLFDTASAAALQLGLTGSMSRNENTRPSYTQGILWPKLTENSPSYSSKYPTLELLNSDSSLSNLTGMYPYYISLYKLVEHWNPDHPDIPPTFVETLQHFNYSNPTERIMAAKFRDAEVPFKIYNVPEVDAVTSKWTPNYLSIKTKFTARVEKASTNHFMFWSHSNMRSVDPKWKPPTETVSMSFMKWHELALKADAERLSNSSEHFYFHSNAKPGDRRGFVAKDLSFFATDKKNFFITNVAANKGIQCRFGMRGIIAETHYDGGKNMVAMIKGQKRYILTPPSSCKYLGIIADRKHTSFRHSIIDWSNLGECKQANFDKVPAIDTIVKEGEVLYIPSYWFHYPISLQYSIQCNSRSGSPPRAEGQDDIEGCMQYKFDTKRDVNFAKAKKSRQ